MSLPLCPSCWSSEPQGPVSLLRARRLGPPCALEGARAAMVLGHGYVGAAVRGGPITSPAHTAALRPGPQAAWLCHTGQSSVSAMASMWWRLLVVSVQLETALLLTWSESSLVPP